MGHRMERRLDLSSGRSRITFVWFPLVELTCIIYRERLSSVELVGETFLLCIEFLHLRASLASGKHFWPTPVTVEEKGRCEILQVGSSSSSDCILLHAIRRTNSRGSFRIRISGHLIVSFLRLQSFPGAQSRGWRDQCFLLSLLSGLFSTSEDLLIFFLPVLFLHKWLGQRLTLVV